MVYVDGVFVDLESLILLFHDPKIKVFFHIFHIF